jgi:hypothetical protein
MVCNKEERDTMSIQYWTCIGGIPRTTHNSLAEAVDVMFAALGETAWACTTGQGGTHEVMDGEHAVMLVNRCLGTIIIGYKSKERADADRDGAYPDAQVERQEV